MIETHNKFSVIQEPQLGAVAQDGLESNHSIRHNSGNIDVAMLTMVDMC
jgi:hypothetical protein